MVFESGEGNRGNHPREWSDHFLICGWHGGVPSIAKQLVVMSGRQVPLALINEVEPERFRTVLEHMTQELVAAGSASMNGGAAVPPLVHVPGNPADVRVLEEATASRARAAIVVADEAGGPSSGADDRSFRFVIALRELSADMAIVAEVQKPDRVPYLRNAGANEVEVKNTRLPFYLVAATRSPGLGGAARQLFGSNSTRAVQKVPVPEALWGRTLAEARGYFRAERGELIIGVITDPERLSVDAVLTSGSEWVRVFIERMMAESTEDVLAEARGTRRIVLNPPDEYVITPQDSAVVTPSARRRAPIAHPPVGPPAAEPSGAAS